MGGRRSADARALSRVFDGGEGLRRACRFQIPALSQSWRTHMHQISPEIQSCIDECLRCHSVCLSMAMNHCLEAGGQHVEPNHFRLMAACAEICQTSANFMLIGTDLHKSTCAVCAKVRSEERRVGKGCVSTCRTRGVPEH